MYCNGVSLVTSATATPHFEWEVPWEKPPVDESRGQGADGATSVASEIGRPEVDPNSAFRAVGTYLS